MYLYNVTISIDEAIEKDWLHWMQSVHIPEVMGTGLFVASRILKMKDRQEGEGITFAVQYTFRNMADYDLYVEKHAPRLQKEHSDRYRDKFVAFRTLLEIIE